MQPMKVPDAYPLSYIEDAFKASTKLVGFPNILLVSPRPSVEEGHH